MTYLEAVEYISQIPKDFFRVQNPSYAGIYEDRAGLYSVQTSPYGIRAECPVTQGLNIASRSYSSNKLTKSPLMDLSKEGRRSPIPCAVRQGINVGSINVFFSTTTHPSHLFGMTAAHTFDQNGDQQISINAKSSLAQPCVGRIDNRYDHHNIADLAILKFDRSVINELYDIEPVKVKTPTPHSVFRIFGSIPESHIGSLELTHVTLGIDMHIYRDLFTTRIPIASGDSGSGVFDFNHSICYGIVIARKDQFTFIQGLTSLHTLLSKEYKIVQFYYLTKKPHR